MEVLQWIAIIILFVIVIARESWANEVHKLLIDRFKVD